MSINPIISPLKLTIKPSIQKWFLIAIPHVLGIAIVLSVVVFLVWLKALLVIMIILSFTYYLRLHLTQSLSQSVLSIQQDSAKNWFITLNDKLKESEPKSVILLPSSFISGVFMVLNYQDNQGSNHCILITKNSNYTNEFRYLMIRIKLEYIKKS